jgi:hypothetical protein
MPAKPIIVPASRGIAWIMQSWSLLRMQAGRLLIIAFLMQMLLGLTQVPLLGILVVISVPGLSAGILEAFHVTGRGGQPALSVLFMPLSSTQHRGRFFALGALVFAVGVLCISVLLPGGEQMPDQELMSRLQQGDVDAVAMLDPDYLGRMVMAFLAGVAISGTISYFTIPLVWFHDRKMIPALLEGLRAMVANWKAFLVLGFGMVVISVPIALLVGFLFNMAGGGGIGSIMVMGFVMMLLLLFQLMLFGTQYCSAREIFGETDTGRPEPDLPGDEGQFVA